MHINLRYPWQQNDDESTVETLESEHLTLDIYSVILVFKADGSRESCHETAIKGKDIGELHMWPDPLQLHAKRKRAAIR